MREITLVTGIGPNGWEEYGSRTLSTIQRWWPACHFILYSELGCTPKELAGWEIRNAESIPGFSEFQEWCSSSPIFSGRRPSSGHRWKPREIKRGYAFRWDAKKFGKMAIYAADAAAITQTGILVWLDADVMTHRTVPFATVNNVLREGADVAYLGRRGTHSETGFVAFRIPEGRVIAKAWGDYYLDRKFVNLPEWHSAYVFDAAVREKAKAPRDLTPGGTGHVWFRSPFRNYADHLKGNERKRKGSSEEWVKNAERRMVAKV